MIRTNRPHRLVRRFATSAIASSSAIDGDLYDLCIVGGGIIGCAVAMQMQRRFPTKTMVLVDKEKTLGQLCRCV